MQDPASLYFKCSDRERAIFEAGIKLGTIYHQYVGAPLNLSNVESLEKAISASASAFIDPTGPVIPILTAILYSYSSTYIKGAAIC